jgi:hypothetical protein
MVMAENSAEVSGMAQPMPVLWEECVPPDKQQIFQCVLQRARQRHIPFALGGGLAQGVYTGRLRSSKDLDIYVTPENRDALVRTVSDCGLTDYFEVKEYVRDWIYRAHRDEIIVDVIWAMANRRAQVDERWVMAGPSIELFGEHVRVVPVEELIWSKLYVMQRDRCDWPDIFNVIYCTASTLDWQHLMNRVAEDQPLVKGVLSIFSWVCPARAAAIPRQVWEMLGLPLPRVERDPSGRPSRKDLLDTRPWLCVDLSPVC